MNLAIVIIIITYGLVVGSFLNVVIYRLPRGENLAYPSSHCPNCNTKLKVRDLVPVFSYLLMGAKCRYCGQKISAVYPIIETINAVLYFLFYVVYGFSFLSVIYMLIASLLLVIFMVDLQRQKILNSLNLAFLCLAIVANFLRQVDWLNAILGAVFSFAFLGGLMLFAKLVKNAGFGWGDLKYVSVSGFLLGFPLALSAFFYTSIAALVAIVYLLLQGQFHLNKRLPFGPFLTFGTIATLLLPNCWL